MSGRDPPMLKLVVASARDVDLVFAHYLACIADLRERGIPQWDERYPTRATATDAATRGDLFLLVDADGVTTGSVILNDLPAPEYAPIYWRDPEPALVIHTLVIHPLYHGAGLGRAAMVSCESFARKRGFASVRLDAFPGNPAAIALYERLGYQARGHVDFGNKPAGHERYIVYEKRL
jgi:ribosomal protein S18 acetylase RimI-like enzyme